MSSLLLQAGSPIHPGTHAAAALAVVIAVGVLGVHTSFAPSLMSPAENSGERIALEAAKAVGLVECGEMYGHAAHVCTAQVRGEDRFQKAELESRYRGTAAAASDARSARAAANHDIANAKCANLARGERTACLLAARL